MTQQDDITQRVLTDDEIKAIRDRLGGGFLGPVPFARAIESALLSKLRAPAAEICIGVSATGQGATVCIMQPHADGTTTAIYSETHPLGDSMGRAALASAPAEPEAAEVDFLVRMLEKMVTWRAEEWSELLERRPAILALLRPMILASAPVAGDGRTRVPGDQLGGPAVAWDDGAQSDQNRPESRASIESKGGALDPVAREAKPSNQEILALAAKHSARLRTDNMISFARDLLSRYAAPQASECECARKSKAVADSEAKL